jgi:hypothetical protein
MGTTAANDFQLSQFEFTIGIDDHHTMLLGFQKIRLQNGREPFHNRRPGRCDLNHTEATLLAFHPRRSASAQNSRTATVAVSPF